LRLAGAFGLLQMPLLLNKFAHTWFILCVKNVSENQITAANKTHSLQPLHPLKVRKCAVFLDRFASPLAVRPKEASDGFHTIGDVMPLTASAHTTKPFA